MKYELSAIELFNPHFMHGVNLGTKITTKNKPIKMFRDDVTGDVDMMFNGKVSGIGWANIASWSYVTVPDALQTLFGLTTTETTETTLPPALAKARRGRPVETEEWYEPVPMPTFDPNDVEAAAAHRAKVRAASANSNRPTAVNQQTDTLIQEARAQAGGFKTKAQVSNPTMPKEGQTGLSGKPKAISHAQLKAQVAAEAKE